MSTIEVTIIRDDGQREVAFIFSETESPRVFQSQMTGHPTMDPNDHYLVSRACVSGIVNMHADPASAECRVAKAMLEAMFTVVDTSKA